MFNKNAVAAVLFLTSFSGCIVKNEPVENSDEQTIRKFSIQWTDAIISKDINAILNIYSEDAVQLQPGGPMLKGKNEIKKWYETWLNDSSLVYSAATEVVFVSESGDLAYERGLYRINDEKGKFLTIWRKINGRWKAVSDVSIPE